MKHLFLFLFAFGLSFNTICQVAIINDKDGFTNIRKTPSSTSEIIYKIQKHQLFLVGEDYNNENKKWTTIFIPKNNFSLYSTPSMLKKGFIHKSRIHFLEELPVYQGKEFSFEYQLMPFSSKNKIIEYGVANWGMLINGLPVWGTDSELPKIEVKNIHIKLNGIPISVPEILIADIYECDNNFTIFKEDATFFIQQWVSDGAGGYELIWVINEEGIQQRFIGAY